MRFLVLFSIFCRSVTTIGAILQFDPQILPHGTGASIAYHCNDRSSVWEHVVNEAAYVRVNPAYTSKSAGSQHWDFTEGPTNQIETVSVVDAKDMPESLRVAFPLSTHALRYSENAKNSPVRWECYEKKGSQRQYLGFQTGTQSPVIFLDENVDFPALITNKMEWFRYTGFAPTTNIMGGAVNAFGSTVEVDGIGDVILPEMGTFPALRIHEIHEWDISLQVITLPLQFIHVYYWLVPGLGKVAEIIYPPVEDPSIVPTKAVSFARAFRIYDDSARFSPGQIVFWRTEADKMRVDWAKSSADSLYVIERSHDISAGQWDVVAVVPDLSGEYPIRNDAAAEFLRIMHIPREKY